MGRLEDLRWMSDTEYADKYSPNGGAIAWGFALLALATTTIILIII